MGKNKKDVLIRDLPVLRRGVKKIPPLFTFVIFPTRVYPLINLIFTILPIYLRLFVMSNLCLEGIRSPPLTVLFSQDMFR